MRTINAKGENVMYNDTHELACRIYKLEDELLRSRNYAEQAKLQSILRKLRLELSKKNRRNSYAKGGLVKALFFSSNIHILL